MTPAFPRVFLLSPALIGGVRSSLLLRDEAEFDLATRLRQGQANIGEAYSFVSGLYFRGKLAYAKTFAAPPDGSPPVLIIVPGLGLVPPETLLDRDQLRRVGEVAVHPENDEFRSPLLRDAAMLAKGDATRFIFLGSIATRKYTDPLRMALGETILVPSHFAGLGNMSRGSLLLRRAASNDELPYIHLGLELHRKASLASELLAKK